MITLRDTRHTTTADFLTSAITVAEYYGFVPFEDVPRTKPTTPLSRERDPSFPRREEKQLAASAKRVLACARTNTLLVWRIVPSHSNPPSVSLELHAVGVSSAISEALLIIAAYAIGEEAGLPGRVLAINSMGSAESSGRFLRDVSHFLRKHLETISPTLRPRVTIDPLGTLMQLIERGHPASPRAPHPIEHLTDDERRRLWDLLEYIEDMHIPYELNPHILGSRDCWSHTMFEVSYTHPTTGLRVPFASGGRYDTLTHRLTRKHIPAAVVTFSCEVTGNTQFERKERTAPPVYFAYIGAEARRRALSVIDVLRHAAIPVQHGILYERMSDQMAAAERIAASYILVMGHKEAADNTVVVREVCSNMQDVVTIADLPYYLKHKKPRTAARQRGSLHVAMRRGIVPAL